MALHHSAPTELLDALRSGGNDLDFVREAMQVDNFPVMAERAAPWAHASSVLVSGDDDLYERAPRQRPPEVAVPPSASLLGGTVRAGPAWQAGSKNPSRGSRAERRSS